MEDRRLIDNFNLKLQNTYVRLPDKFYTKQYPEEVPNPILVAFNDSLADMLGLDKDFLESSDGIAIMSGNGILEGTTPIAEAYAGHQFGYFTMLGDGRAVLLGEVISETGERYDIQLKGSGRTRYSKKPCCCINRGKCNKGKCFTRSCTYTYSSKSYKGRNISICSGIW